MSKSIDVANASLEGDVEDERAFDAFEADLVDECRLLLERDSSPGD